MRSSTLWGVRGQRQAQGVRSSTGQRLRLRERGLRRRNVRGRGSRAVRLPVGLSERSVGGDALRRSARRPRSGRARASQVVERAERGFRAVTSHLGAAEDAS